jgi:hypothetical protein
VKSEEHAKAPAAQSRRKAWGKHVLYCDLRAVD